MAGLADLAAGMRLAGGTVSQPVFNQIGQENEQIRALQQQAQQFAAQQQMQRERMNMDNELRRDTLNERMLQFREGIAAKAQENVLNHQRRMEELSSKNASIEERAASERAFRDQQTRFLAQSREDLARFAASMRPAPAPSLTTIADPENPTSPGLVMDARTGRVIGQAPPNKGVQAQVTSNEARLRDDYTKMSGTFMKIRDAHQRVLASSNNPSPAGDLALIFNYMKILDPESVVRESEFAQAAATGAFGERIQGYVGKIVSGKRLTDDIRKDFVDRSERLYADAEKNQLGVETQFSDISKRSGADPANVVIPHRVTRNQPQTKTWEDADYEYRELPSGEIQRRKKGK